MPSITFERQFLIRTGRTFSFSLPLKKDGASPWSKTSDLWYQSDYFTTKVHPYFFFFRNAEQALEIFSAERKEALIWQTVHSKTAKGLGIQPNVRWDPPLRFLKKPSGFCPSWTIV